MTPVRGSSALYVTCIIGVGLIVGRLIPPLAVRFEGQAPRPGLNAALLLAVGAAVVGVFAWHTWQNVHKNRRQINAEHGIRMLALAKASIMVGGVFAGGYAGFAWAYFGSESEAGTERFINGTAAALAAVALLVAALLLERACRLPADDEDGDSTASQADPDPGLARES